MLVSRNGPAIATRSLDPSDERRNLVYIFPRQPDSQPVSTVHRAWPASDRVILLRIFGLFKDVDRGILFLLGRGRVLNAAVNHNFHR
jgi:hypothetical protein